VFTELRIVDLLIDLQMSTGATTSPAPKRLETASTQDPLWYKDAIIYQAHVRAFLDTSNDGVGDFRGLTEKLDYLEALGIDTIWLLPFYPSPLRDDGYDIADYENINPAYGTLADFDRFIEEAHRRKLRVITELVINHTSDQHPWFQAARRAPAGSRERNFYVWSDTNQKYQGVPVIFSDSEKSNWTWDDTAGAYYWHRFFHHQPDLNFDNPEVLEAVTRVMHFWLDRGVDGLRLDAVPYLIEREGTSGANLEETHAVLKAIRREMDARHANRVLLAEANQWPADVRPYFGEGDECHMAFNFPLMPRMFMALRLEDRHPIVEILRQTPDIPESCQWGLFLRNHDELTLEMVTDEERDYMHQWYATDPQMRINGGIRRRLAPLMENSRRRIELMNSLLFSLPGTPVIYYGDELGMGDNIYLGDRSSVRTPMQWTGDRNAGFSRADSARLFAPVITDPVYGYAAVNVEAQERSPFSLLNWMKRLIALRRQHIVFGRGTIEFLPAQNRKILAYVRQYQDETILCVANLSRSVQPVELDLSRFRGMVPVEMLGQTEFPRIGDQPYFLSLGAYAFNWFRLQQASTPVTERTTSEATAPTPDVPALMVGAVWDTLLDGSVRMLIERDLLGPFLQRQAWFQGPRPRFARFRDWSVLRRGREPLFLGIVEVEFEESAEDRTVPRQYFLPLSMISAENAKTIQERVPHAVLARVTGARKGILFDGWHDDRFAEVLLDIVSTGSTVAMRRGILSSRQTEAYPQLRRASDTQLFRPASLPVSSTIDYGNQLSLKLYRRVEPGVHSEIEVTEHLKRAGFLRASEIAAVVNYDRQQDAPSSMAMMSLAVESQADGWTHAMDWLGRYFDQVTGRELPAAPTPASFFELTNASAPSAVRDLMSAYLEIASTLGKRTAEMHLALAADPVNPGFAPEPFGREDLAVTGARAAAQAERTLQALESGLQSGQLRVPDDVARRARRLLAARDQIVKSVQPDGLLTTPTVKTRIHGDYRLAQVLLAEGDFYIQNFEGHLSWPSAAQREKQSPLRDVAAMVRSFSYVAHAALFTRATARPDDLANLEPWAHLWQTWATASFLQQYLATAGDASFLPADRVDRDEVLRLFMLDRALRELDGELNNRPDWIGIPIAGILKLLEMR
jgi:maltose alpha-D-glucosyltransferase/alpha-amylase